MRAAFMVTENVPKPIKETDPKSLIHQTLETISNCVVLYKYSTDFNGPVSVLRGKSGCLEIENDDGEVTHGEYRPVS